MSTELTDAEAQKIFREVQGAIRDNDTAKLDELLTAPEADTEEVETPVEVEVPAEVPEVETPENDENSPQEEPAEEVEVGTEDKTVNEPDPLADMRKQLEKLSAENHALRSQAGRVPHVQRRLKELDEKLQALEKRSTSPSSRPSTALTPKIMEQLKGIKETDPELAETIAAAIAAATDGVTEEQYNREKEILTLSREEALKEYRQEQVNILLEEYPNAPDVFKSSHWKDWKKSQSAAVQTLANSDTAEDVIFAMNKYAEDMVRKYPELAKVNEQPAQALPAANNAAAKIEADRLRKKMTGATVTSPAAASKVQMNENPEQLFKMFSELAHKQRLGL